MDLNTSYAGLSLRNPIIIGSSGLTSGAERVKEYEKAGAGAIVLKSLFEEQIEMQSSGMLDKADFPEASDYVYEYMKANKIESYLDLIRRCKEACSIPVIASINCYKADAWIDFAGRIELAGADAIELNVFRMNTGLKYDPQAESGLYADIVAKVRKTVGIPVTVKIGKALGCIPATAGLLKANGAAGVVLFNRFYQPDINIHTMQIVSGNVFSNHSELSETLRWTAIVSGRIPGISIAASTGVHDWEDVLKCLLAGASAVQMVSAIYTHGAEIIPQILTCLEEWMHHSDYESVDDFRGLLNYSQIENHEKYERAQFMKYFSDRD
ncbi:MAG: dihydroorotate dehydrogenase-like protein [Tannerellaceae bacterium]|jgi:dihydroorotate dehydrogenase (fumarate)|nr:dihydroorotate dehydrogenase-like protein [Tannerellaceae bacterium]